MPPLSGPSTIIYHPPPLPGARQTIGTQTGPCMPDVVTNQRQELSPEVNNLQTLVKVEMRRSLVRLREDIWTQQQQRATEQTKEPMELMTFSDISKSDQDGDYDFQWPCELNMDFLI